MSTALMPLVIGSIGGFLSGFLGIGGGVILLPLMVYLGQMPIKEATAISMWFVIFASISGIIAHKKLGNIDLGIGLWLGGGSVAGAVIGTRFAGILSDKMLQVVFIGVVFAAAIMLLVPSREDDPEVDLTSEGRPSKVLALTIGLAKGILTGILGIGGGFIVVPLMICVLHIRTIKAVGTSLVVTFLSAIAALVSKAMMSEFVWSGTAPGIILGGIVFAQLGSRAASRVDAWHLRRTLFALLLMIAAKMVLELVV